MKYIKHWNFIDMQNLHNFFERERERERETQRQRDTETEKT